MHDGKETGSVILYIPFDVDVFFFLAKEVRCRYLFLYLNH
jgi:hypothetical protein